VKLVQAMAGAPHGGAEAFFVRLALALARRGLDQTAVIRNHQARARALTAGGVAVATLPFGGALDRRTVPALRRLLDGAAPELALSWMSRATRALARARQGARARMVHVARLGGYYDLKYYRGCDRLIANTPDIVAYLRESGWPAERAHYLPNFVDAARAPALARAPLATPEDAPLVLALGRLHPNKGFDVLLAALAELPRHWLWLAGAGPAERALKALARRLGVAERVRFLGWRDDAPALLAAADLLVCSSRIEPLGNVVIEAWAHGVPVVACAAAGPRQLIDDRVNGLLVPIDDAGALAAAVRGASEPGLGAALAEAGTAAFAVDFTEAKVVARYLDFFASLPGAA
jgi:glycosyltransferase involved in cell wall biosynthesis